VTQKTNAARFLSQMGIHHELRQSEVDPEDLASETVAVKVYPVFADKSIERFDLISISTGVSTSSY
jgi:prolyl-tRNA editing enzyme YbaK/EbsC (Cys-tRNA(Pro) deacylase)